MSKALRYIVEFADSETVSYNCGLGNREARQYAAYTASRYGGIITVENIDGTKEVYRDYTRQKSYL